METTRIIHITVSRHMIKDCDPISVDHCMVAQAARAAGLMDALAGVRFLWTGGRFYKLPVEVADKIRRRLWDPPQPVEPFEFDLEVAA